MKKIIVFTGSNSSNSINRQLSLYTASKLPEGMAEIINLNNFTVPLYSEDLERAEGIPAPIVQLHALFKEANGFIIASPEHNGLLPAFFKNTIDWLSRVDRNIFRDRPALLLSTSNGGYGGQFGLKILESILPRFGAQIVGSFSLGNFNENFDTTTGSIVNTIEMRKLEIEMERLVTAVEGEVLNTVNF
ncbi:NAD(P)H-dependent FMN reductase [Ulvibacter sp. MAR_2010_11]|uniref:NADPH-dependent FMN reductase n=1 Tax=Ulvibacter sp. MAR_2010_11 TaxID=1250229 RepID=UPI000C2C0152|nr:NAD(P)H-dependent oxidoreductase [Ulvibacter sp. MAR_2010_11]PKA83825.1 NAD(P)H-dependent FMN reductase [Ulvibacter sp. MAR_2010_11]